MKKAGFLSLSFLLIATIVQPKWEFPDETCELYPDRRPDDRLPQCLDPEKERRIKYSVKTNRIAISTSRSYITTGGNITSSKLRWKYFCLNPVTSFGEVCVPDFRDMELGVSQMNTARGFRL